MVSLNVSLPALMKDWVESQADGAHYRTASDYIRELIRRDQERAAYQAELQQRITEGIESGISNKSMEDVLALARAEASKSRKDHAV